MPGMKKNTDDIVPWKAYLSAAIETGIAFYVATLCLAIFFTQRGDSTLLMGLMGILYFTVIGLCLGRIIQKFSMAALMIVIPIAPLLALFSVVSLIPVLELIKIV